MKPTVFAPSARTELEATAEWYESQAGGLGEKFVDCVDDIIVRVGTAPTEFPIWDGDHRFRKAVLQRFPHVIFVCELSDAIQVGAVAHTAREPGDWLKRK